jgi:phosphoglycerate-specific signal transduction histidine kinase
LQQVVLNLILNAVEAMSSVGDTPRELEISTERSGTDEILVAVRDSGPGINRNIWKPFSATSIPPSQVEWGWAFRFVALSLMQMGEDYGQMQMSPREPSSNSLCR